jgi:hypothetical protein
MKEDKLEIYYSSQYLEMSAHHLLLLEIADTYAPLITFFPQ